MDGTAEIFISLLRRAIVGTDEKTEFTQVDFGKLYALARSQDLAHVIYYELKRENALGECEVFVKFKTEYNNAMWRHIQRGVALSQVKSALCSAGIPYVPLKGLVIMDLYPEPFMRTSADIDVLVRKSDFDNAVKALTAVGLRLVSETDHDVTLCNHEDFHIELHHSLLEDDRLPAARALLSDPWKYASPIGDSAEYGFSDEFFYFYNIAHTAKHFKNGGNGVRSVIDIWLLNNKTGFDAQKRRELITAGEMTVFEDKIKALSEVWFSGKEKDDTLAEIEEYVITGGLYGTLEQSVNIRVLNSKRQLKTGRFGYYIRRVFLPYSQIKFSYPVLKKIPILLPLFWVVRWFKILKPDIRKKTIREIKIERDFDMEKTQKLELLFSKLEIM